MTEIRKARIKDLEVLENLQKQLYGKSFAASRSDLMRAITSRHVWIAAALGEIIGYQLCELFGPTQKNFPNSIFLSELFVIQDFRKKGVGTLLVEAALNESWPAEYRYFSLTHDPHQTFLTKYYEKFGFKECGKTDVGNNKMTRPRKSEWS